MSIDKLLDLSTGNMLGPDPSFGSCRVQPHEYGWIVFVSPDNEEVPEWLQPAHSYAVEHDCILINFDRDGDVDEALPQWDW